LEVSTPWNPQGLSRLVLGLLYLCYYFSLACKFFIVKGCVKYEKLLKISSFEEG